MSANVDAMVREAVRAYRAGNKEEAKGLLLKAVELDQYNEQGWLWLSAVVDDPEDQRTCLENVLSINPNNDRARQGLDMLKQKTSGAAAAKPPAVPAADDPFAGMASFGSPEPTPATSNPFAAASDEETPTSIEWDAPATETSSPSSTWQPADELSSEDYDAWVTNLNLPASDQPAAPAASTATSSPFGDDFNFDSSGDDPFSAGPFTSAGPFDAPIEEQAPPAKPTPAPAVKPTPKWPEPASPKSSLPIEDDTLLSELEDEELLHPELLEDYDQAQMGDLDPSEFYKYIPKEIKATRLPGTTERYPVMLMLGLIILIVLNIGAVIMLATRLAS